MEINKNVLVTGSNGQLAKSINFFSRKYPYNFFFETKSKLDITDHSSVNDFLEKKNIKVIINCAAYTDVSNANKDYLICDSINHLAVSNLANYCNKFNVKLIHISTDYVFDGNKKNSYVEEDFTNPLNNYGITKLNAEKKILGYNLKNSVIIRTSWLYSLNKKNFLGKILKNLKTLDSFNVVDDQISSPTNPYDLAKIILEMIPLINNDSTEIYHFSNLGSCSRYEMAKK